MSGASRDLIVLPELLHSKNIICTCGSNRSWPHGRLEGMNFLPVLDTLFYDGLENGIALFKQSLNMNDFDRVIANTQWLFLLVPACQRRRNVMMGDHLLSPIPSDKP
jgi:hypothetical protein